MKSLVLAWFAFRWMSHPARGAWIEIEDNLVWSNCTVRRTPHGVRGLKWARALAVAALARRTPHGVRGLKFLIPLYAGRHWKVAPRTGCVD